MRADRLVATLLLLQSRGRVTARELADELEVSVPRRAATWRRCPSAGIPVYPQPGRGGGWQLVGGARTDLSGLSAPEAQALFLLVGPAAAVSDDAKAALRKLVRALPSTFRADAEVAAVATMIDPSRWGERDRPRPALVDRLQAAVVGRRRVRLTYHRHARGPLGAAGRPVGPGRQGRRLVPRRRHRPRAAYLPASTGSSAAEETERRASCGPTTSTSPRPGRRSSSEMEALRSRTWATVSIESRLVGDPARPLRPALPPGGRGRRRAQPRCGSARRRRSTSPAPCPAGARPSGARAARRAPGAGPHRA